VRGGDRRRLLRSPRRRLRQRQRFRQLRRLSHGTTCGTCPSGQICGGNGVPNACGLANTTTYEAEAIGNVVAGDAIVTACAEAYSKVKPSGNSGPGNADGTVAFIADPATASGACSGGAKISLLGSRSSNYVTINDVSAPVAGNYQLTVWGISKGSRTFSISANGSNPISVTINGPDALLPVSATTGISLKAGMNSLKFYNSQSQAPELDRILITSGTCTPETNAQFCGRVRKNCGAVADFDNCGKLRMVSSCGSCGSLLSCGGGGEPGACGSGKTDRDQHRSDSGGGDNGGGGGDNGGGGGGSGSGGGGSGSGGGGH
jgi:hypothetical protein